MTQPKIEEIPVKMRRPKIEDVPLDAWGEMYKASPNREQLYECFSTGSYVPDHELYFVPDYVMFPDETDPDNKISGQFHHGGYLDDIGFHSEEIDELFTLHECLEFAAELGNDWYTY